MSNDFLNSKIYKIIYYMLNIGLWIAILLSCISLIFFISNPNQAIEAVGLSYDGFFINNSIYFESTHLHSLLFLILLVTFSSGLLCIFLLRNIINSLKFKSPFNNKTVSRLRIIGWTLFIETYIKQLLNYLYIQSLSDYYTSLGLNSLLQARFNLLPDKIIWILCILIIAEIFKYGCTLQHEHDTTV